mmetsp:Transcript_6420/g.9754  ORF Transcript_6420/g.9754 Transcript_6420/m.9754 type:complete len:149 (-) Transcript_6420:1985-2431(-)
MNQLYLQTFTKNRSKSRNRAFMSMIGTRHKLLPKLHSKVKKNLVMPKETQTPLISRTMTQMVVIDSSLWDVNSDDNCSFYEEVRAIHDMTHPDITTPMNGEDTLLTHMIPYHFIKSPSKTRLLSREKLPLMRKYSSSSSITFDTVKNQ